MLFFKVNKSFPTLNDDQINNRKKFRENDNQHERIEIIEESYATH